MIYSSRGLGSRRGVAKTRIRVPKQEGLREAITSQPSQDNNLYKQKETLQSPLKKVTAPKSPREYIIHAFPLPPNSETSERLPDCPVYRKYVYERRGQFRENEEKALRPYLQ